VVTVPQTNVVYGLILVLYFLSWRVDAVREDLAESYTGWLGLGCWACLLLLG
jgi:hypothetical protein